jgi:hypothetical protein
MRNRPPQARHLGLQCGLAKNTLELVEKRAEATSEAQDIVTSTAILSTVLFADGTVEPFFNKLLEPLVAAKQPKQRSGREQHGADDYLRAVVRVK